MRRVIDYHPGLVLSTEKDAVLNRFDGLVGDVVLDGSGEMKDHDGQWLVSSQPGGDAVLDVSGFSSEYEGSSLGSQEFAVRSFSNASSGLVKPVDESVVDWSVEDVIDDSLPGLKMAMLNSPEGLWYVPAHTPWSFNSSVNLGNILEGRSEVVASFPVNGCTESLKSLERNLVSKLNNSLVVLGSIFTFLPLADEFDDISIARKKLR